MKRLFAAIIILFLGFSLYGCEVTGEQIEKARKSCEPNGGLGTVFPDGGEFACANGAEFYFSNLQE